MKLAEALLLRADRNRSLEQLKQRSGVSARYQEGEFRPILGANPEASPETAQVARGRRKRVQIPP
jgi:hypothetical protein